MLCVTTRFQLKHFWYLLPMYLAYRGLRRDLKVSPGLIRYAFLLQSPLACFTISIWESEQALIIFSNTTNHINAVRRAKQLCRSIWSTYWHIHAVSKYANQWPGAIPLPSLSGPFVPVHRARQMNKQGGTEWSSSEQP